MKKQTREESNKNRKRMKQKKTKKNKKKTGGGASPLHTPSDLGEYCMRYIGTQSEDKTQTNRIWRDIQPARDSAEFSSCLKDNLTTQNICALMQGFPVDTSTFRTPLTRTTLLTLQRWETLSYIGCSSILKQDGFFFTNFGLRVGCLSEPNSIKF
jgi:hypothetical protein